VKTKWKARDLTDIRRINDAARVALWAGIHSFSSASNFSGIPRETSFPFISSHTFHSIADIVITTELAPEDLETIRPNLDNRVVMVELSFIKNHGGAEPLLRWVASYSAALGKKLNVIFHMHDWVPDDKYLVSLTNAGANVFCVNVLDGLPGVTPIPVGLENAIRRKNGVLHDFLFVYDQIREPEPSFPLKKQEIFSSFKISTNPREREPLAKLLSQSRFGFAQERLPIKEFRKGILDAKFVISPPGNGPDCYRTWESIYLGSVPIVLKNSLADSLHTELPIWAVDSWEEALDASSDALDQKYEELIHRARDKAYFPYWLKMIAGLGAA
jgi:hypothetical protein